MFVDVDGGYTHHASAFAKPTYFDIVKNEYWACRETVCLVDMSSFTKTEVRVRGLTHILLFTP